MKGLSTIKSTVSNISKKMTHVFNMMATCPGKCDDTCDGMCDDKCPADQGPAPALQWSGGSNDTPVTAPHNSQHSQQSN